MLDLPRQMVRTLLTTTTTTVLATVPTGVIWVVRSVIITNATGTAANCTLALAGTPLMNTLQVGASATTIMEISQVLTAGQSITGGASTASALHVHVAGIEVVL